MGSSEETKRSPTSLVLSSGSHASDISHQDTHTSYSLLYSTRAGRGQTPQPGAQPKSPLHQGPQGPGRGLCTGWGAQGQGLPDSGWSPCSQPAHLSRGGVGHKACSVSELLQHKGMHLNLSLILKWKLCGHLIFLALYLFHTVIGLLY